jgi:hypothetical protein
VELAGLGVRNSPQFRPSADDLFFSETGMMPRDQTLSGKLFDFSTQIQHIDSDFSSNSFVFPWTINAKVSSKRYFISELLP